MPTGAELAIQRETDVMSAWQKALINATLNRTYLWSIVQASDDLTLINDVLGQPLYKIDLTMNNVSFGGSLQIWFNLHNTYFQDSTNNPTPLNNFSNALATWQWRASQFWAQLYFQSAGSKLPNTEIFPRDDLSQGSYARTGAVFTAGTNPLDTTYSIGGMMEAVTTSIIGGVNLVLTGTFTRTVSGNPTININATVLATSPVGTAVVFGQQVLSGNAASGQSVIPVATTSQFLVGEPVLVQDNQGNGQFGYVNAISPGVSITIANPLRFSFLTANSATVTPIFQGITNVTSTGGTNGDAVNFFFAPDRPLSLTIGGINPPIIP